MSKIEVIGPQDQLVPVLETIRHSRAMHVDADIQHRMASGAEAGLARLAPDARTMRERLFDEDLAKRLQQLLALLPAAARADSGIDPGVAVDAIASTLAPRIARCESHVRRREALRAESAQLDRHLAFLTVVASLVTPADRSADREAIAVQLRDRDALDRFVQLAATLHVEVHSAKTHEGSYVGLLTTERPLAERLRQSLREDRIPETRLPAYLEGLSLEAKLAAAHARRRQLEGEMADNEARLQRLAERWRPMYEDVLRWLEGRLALLKTTALSYSTDNCFVLFGWAPTAKLAGLRAALAERYHGTVVVEEKAIVEHDLETVPVTLQNRAYFRPFERLVLLLPLPRYGSIDPTPFVGIFFPLFFGMMLGDIGYGLLVLTAAVALVFGTVKPPLQDAGRVLGVCGVYSLLFGVLYGECLGDVGARAIGLTPWIDRRTSLLPMLYFSVAVGVVHVLVGFLLGIVTSIRTGNAREAGFRASMALSILLLGAVIALALAPVEGLVRAPLVGASALVAIVLFVTGGVLAPFELLRSLGNIISYARIMAVGLASVLLAYVANQLAGAAGSVWLGVLIAIVLHAFNLVLGIFAPAIHALRLQYVEFFSKFFEPGGKPFHPLEEFR